MKNTSYLRSTRIVALFLVLLLVLTSSAFASDVPLQGTPLSNSTMKSIEDFTDLTCENEFYSSIVYVINNGIMDGETDSQFAPDSPADRQELVEALYRMEDSPVMLSTAEFADVTPDSGLEDAVSWGNCQRNVKHYLFP